MEMSDEDKKRAVDYIGMAKVKLAAGVASGSMACMSCGADVKLNMKDGNQWDVNCSCGWKASGIGVFSGSLN